MTDPQPELGTITIDLGTTSIPMAYRVNTKDRYTIEENWSKHPYRLNKFGEVARREFIDQEYARICAAGETPLIIDAGANIGASALFFSWRYPAARIVGVEPDLENFRILRRNVADRPNISVTRAAVASVDGEARLYDPGRSTDAYRTTMGTAVAQGADLGSVPALSIPTLVRIAGGGATPFLVKIDIEGAEAELFSQGVDWVDDFPAIAIELNDWMLPGAASSASFLRCVSERGRDFINPAATDIVFSLKNPSGKLATGAERAAGAIYRA